MKEEVKLIIDNGTETIKAGGDSDDLPTVFATAVGRPKLNLTLGEPIIGDEVFSKKMRSNLAIKYPIENGIVTNWDDMERIWHHTFYQALRVAPEEHKVLLSEAPCNPKANKEKMTQLMMETFKVQALCVPVQAVMSLYANGKTSGLVLDSGARVSHTVAIAEGLSIQSSVLRLDVAGRSLTDYFMKIISERGYVYFNTPEEKDTLKNIKEKVCFVSLDFYEDMKTADCSSSLEKSYELPDGQVLTFSNERFRCPEAFFEPALLGLGCQGIHKQVENSIIHCQEELRKGLFGNIVISGGNTMFPGFVERLQKEVGLLNPYDDVKVAIIGQSERKFSVWKGGCVMTALSSLQNMWLTKQEYDEDGPSLIHQKSF